MRETLKKMKLGMKLDEDDVADEYDIDGVKSTSGSQDLEEGTFCLWRASASPQKSTSMKNESS